MTELTFRDRSWCIRRDCNAEPIRRSTLFFQVMRMHRLTAVQTITTHFVPSGALNKEQASPLVTIRLGFHRR
jgi:hypothetical protein